ncbi:MAG: transglycosylase SLT domain-containing protein [Kofleriaceae bacterium]|nr:transglycosylase SLT domain-containing protein [Kofleriaceae bacterium]
MRRQFHFALYLLPILIALAANPGVARASTASDLGEAYALFEAGHYEKALARAKTISRTTLQNPDILQYLVAQSLYFKGDYAAALHEFAILSKTRASRFFNISQWRKADCLWQLQKYSNASSAYVALLQKNTPEGEEAVARFRIAKAAGLASTNPKEAIAAYKDFLRKHPGHRLSEEADRELVRLGDKGLEGMSPKERIQRGIDLIKAKKWEIALQELASLDTSSMSEATKLDHKFWLSMSLFKRRRHYHKAGKTFLEIYKKMGPRAAEALFHGARAMSRADFDKEAIAWYQVLVRDYSSSKWAAEAQFLSGWLEFNLENYKEAIPYLTKMGKRYSNSRFAKEVPWYLGMSHFQLQNYPLAIGFFEKVSKQGGKEIGGKGKYWKARALHKSGKVSEAVTLYKGLVSSYPFSWYALLSRSHLQGQGIEISPFGDKPVSRGKVPEIAQTLDKRITRDPLLTKANELIEAKLYSFAGRVLRRGEKGFFKRHSGKKSLAMAVLLDAYKRAQNFNRPWMLAIVHGGKGALNVAPKGNAKIWWQHAYPLAYQEIVERYRKLSGFPDYYLYTIMRKESGFAPHTHSYADAQGLLQMIPPTTERVVPHLGLQYTEDLLFDPERNIQVGAWYIGRLLHKFRMQIPIGAGSYNGGPRAVMRWLKKLSGRPIDEYVELVSYRQTRKYMKRTTETYARYKFLYDNVVYEQPLILNSDFVRNDIDY